MNWVVTAALARLMADFRETFPNKDRSSDGTIGDAAHQAETSGHNPDDTPGSKAEYSDADSKPEVRAIDVDNDLNDPRGTTMQQVIDRMLQTPADLRRLKYIIYNRRIWSRNTSWQSRAYTGSSPHTEHAHFSGDPDTDEDNGPWTSVLSFKEDDMDARQAEQNANADTYAWHLAQLDDQVPGILANGKTIVVPNVLAQTVKAIAAKVAEIDAKVAAPAPLGLTDADREDIANRVVAKLGELVFKAQ